MRESILISVQTAPVAAGTRGYQSSRPLLAPFRIDTILAEVDVPSALIYICFGTAYSPVTSQLSAAASLSFITNLGVTSTSGLRSHIPLPNGTIIFTGLNFYVPSSQQLLWIECVNGTASDSCRLNCTFQGEYLTSEDSVQLDPARAIADAKAADPALLRRPGSVSLVPPMGP